MEEKCSIIQEICFFIAFSQWIGESFQAFILSLRNLSEHYFIWSLNLLASTSVCTAYFVFCFSNIIISNFVQSLSSQYCLLDHGQFVESRLPT